MRHTATRRLYGHGLRIDRIPFKYTTTRNSRGSTAFPSKRCYGCWKCCHWPEKTTNAVTPCRRCSSFFLIALRFYGAGIFQVVTGDLVNVSQATVSRIIAPMSRMIAETLFPQLVKFPSANDLASVTEKFYTIARFTGESGRIDCTHVPIRSPGGDDVKVFRCRDGYFSINVQSGCNDRTAFSKVLDKLIASRDELRKINAELEDVIPVKDLEREVGSKISRLQHGAEFSLDDAEYAACPNDSCVTELRTSSPNADHQGDGKIALPAGPGLKLRASGRA
ncbi:hypothetical protein HPB49_013365 [Dermacentor silvarum]|uniref:Uncharacterized protein n=1 Tax=Dermacentor silvarum TaxID=543639 RepID=A0ACB8C3V4_DERSI|nr:hypothetical protein HPB49_013365 [Dermacentor silvarum]